MKRDMELIRAILLDAEGEENIDLSNYTDEQIGYHIYLLGTAGFAETGDLKTLGSKYPKHRVKSLTWQGHEFLDMIKSDTVWKQTKDYIRENGAKMSLAMIQAVVIGYSKSQLGL